MTLSELIADMAASHPDNRMFACFSKAEILDRLRTALDDKAALTAAERDLAEARGLLEELAKPHIGDSERWTELFTAIDAFLANQHSREGA